MRCMLPSVPLLLCSLFDKSLVASFLAIFRSQTVALMADLLRKLEILLQFFCHYFSVPRQRVVATYYGEHRQQASHYKDEDSLMLLGVRC